MGKTEIQVLRYTPRASLLSLMEQRIPLGRGLKIISFLLSAKTNCPKLPSLVSFRTEESFSFAADRGYISLAASKQGFFHGKILNVRTPTNVETEVKLSVFNGSESDVNMSLNILVEREKH